MNVPTSSGSQTYRFRDILREGRRRHVFVSLTIGMLTLAGCLASKEDPTRGFEMDLDRFVNQILECTASNNAAGLFLGEEQPLFEKGARYVMRKKTTEPLVYTVERTNGEEALSDLKFTQLKPFQFATFGGIPSFVTYRIEIRGDTIEAFALPVLSEVELAKSLHDLPQKELRERLQHAGAKFSQKEFEFQLVTPPKAIKPASPDYPRSLRKKNLEGQVLLEVAIDETGRVTNVHVTSASYPEMGDAAVKAMRQAKYQPATRAGKPVAATISVPIRFKLQP